MWTRTAERRRGAMSDEERRGPKRPLVGASIGRRAKFAQKVSVPVGLEKVLYLAARDPELKERLLADRAGTIDALGVQLRPSERAMLEASPAAALEAMIGRIDASNPRRRRFMGLVAAAATSLAAGTALPSCDTVDHDATPNYDSGGDGPDIDIDTDTDTVDTDTNIFADAGGAGPDVDAGDDAGSVDTDTDTYAGGGALTDLAPEDLEKK
jgi:hypothetical protein